MEQIKNETSTHITHKPPGTFASGEKYKYQQMIFYTNKNTNKKCGKCKNWMEHLGNTKLSKTSVYKGFLLDCGIIWNSMKYECGGGGVHHLC